MLFASFAGASFYMGWIGQTSCGCAGAAVSVSPWYAFGLDLFVLVMLLLGRPDLRAAWAEPRRHLLRATLPAALGVGGVMLFSLAMLGTASVSFGSVAAAIAYLRNDRVSIGPRLLDLGTAEAGKEIEFAVDVTNWTDQPVRVIGGAQDCSCTLPGHLPLTIAPRETQAVAVSVRLPSKAGIFTRKVGLFIDDQGFRRTSFTLTGRVSPSGVKDADGG